jgi:hypothetical protein
VPELHFRIDPSIDEATRITDAIRREHDLGRVSAEEPEPAFDAETGSDEDDS